MRWYERQGTIPRTILVGAALLLSAASLLPLVETNAWWVRFLDFPRVHYLVGLLVIAILYVLLGGFREILGWIAFGLMLLAAGYNLYKLHPYAPLMPKAAIEAETCPEGSRLRVLIANLQAGSNRSEAIIDIVRRHDPDLVLAMETDPWWNARLSVLDGAYPYNIGYVDQGFFGIELFSKYPLDTPEIRFLTPNDAPSVFTRLRLPNGSRIAFYGIHPEPPMIGQASTWRDAQILAAAIEARAAKDPVVVAGDLNAVPWERVVRRAMRVGGLLDPRVGRGYLATYDTRQVPLLWWPLDQVLFQDEFAVTHFERLPEFGSDHYPLLAELCHLPAAAERQQAPVLVGDDLEEALAALETGLRPEALRRVLSDAQG